MPSQNNKAVVHAYVHAFNRGAWDEMQYLFAPDALIYGVLGWGPLPDVLRIWTQLHDSLSMTLELIDMVAEGDVVAVRCIERGTSVAPFFDYPHTGKSYEVMAMEWLQLKDGKIERRWGARDSTAIYKQLGF